MVVYGKKERDGGKTEWGDRDQCYTTAKEKERNKGRTSQSKNALPSREFKRMVARRSGSCKRFRSLPEDGGVPASAFVLGGSIY